MNTPARLSVCFTTVTVVACVSSSLSCGPARPLPAGASQLVASWFVTPAPARRDSIDSMRLSSGELDSLFRASRCADRSTERFVQTVADSTGRQYRLGFATPASYRCDTVYPLVVYLHGGTGVAEAVKGDHAWEMLLPLADSLPLFFASPSASRDVPWWSPDGLRHMLQTVRFMTLRFPIDPDRIFLAGVSDGATGCYAAANTIWGPFAGFVAISGSGLMLRQMGFPMAPSNMMQRPIYNVYAGKDRLYPAELTREFLASLRQAGVDVTESFHPDEEHGFDYRATEWGALAGLLRTWRRPSQRAVSCVLIPGAPLAPGDMLVSWQPAGSAGGSVESFVHRDTLVVRGRGLRSMVVAFPGAAPSFLRVNNNTAVRLDPAASSASLLMALAQASSRPPDAAAVHFCSVHFSTP